MAIVEAVEPAIRVNRARRRGGRTELYWYLGSLALLFGTWEVIARLTQAQFLPPFSDVVVRLQEEVAGGPVLDYLLTSLSNLAIGFAIAASLGLAVGLAMGLSKPAAIALEPYVYGLMTAPSIVFVPIYFSLFGLSRWSIVALIVQYATTVIIIDTFTAVRHVDKELIEMSQVFGSSRRQTIRYVVLRAALPLTMTGLRLGLGRSIKGMVNGELLIALVGLGGAIMRFGGVFDAEGVLALVLLILVISLVLLKGFTMLDRRVNHWLPANQH